MPIRIPDALPAAALARNLEHLCHDRVPRAAPGHSSAARAHPQPHAHQDRHRDADVCAKLSNTPLQVEVDLLRTKAHEATHVSAGHLETFYRTFDDVRDIHYDGLMSRARRWNRCRSKVDYWPELCQMWIGPPRTYSTLHICWGAQVWPVPSLRYLRGNVPPAKAKRRVRALWWKPPK